MQKVCLLIPAWPLGNSKALDKSASFSAQFHLPLSKKLRLGILSVAFQRQNYMILWGAIILILRSVNSWNVFPSTN